MMVSEFCDWPACLVGRFHPVMLWAQGLARGNAKTTAVGNDQGHHVFITWLLCGGPVLLRWSIFLNC